MDERPDWARIEAGLDLLLDLPEAERPAVLARLTVDDPALRRELETLLAQAGADESWLDRPAVDALADEAAPIASLAPGRRVGAYRIIALLGTGGMGEVYRAERDDGQFEQAVALKLIRREAIDQLDRFQAERQILARLSHPGITRIYDGGVLDDGQPYMVMELVDGQKITEWCRARGADLETRLRLFLAVAEAVAYAHRNFVVHRDIKPSNVLVTADGQVKLLDFGIAKRLADPSGLETRLAPLTLDYAAPEQLTGAPISTATDSYALGMLLFELLAGRPPWGLGDLPIAVAVERILREVPPVPSRVADGAVAPKALRGDFDAIVAKALRKEPAHRYETVDRLIRDVARSRRGEPVSARQGSRLYVLGRFLRRHRLPAASAALILLALLVGFSGVTWQYLRAQHEAERATAIKTFLVSLFRASDPRIASDQPRGEITAKQLLDQGTARIETEFAGDPDLEIELLGITGDIYGYLLDDDRYNALQAKRVALARARYGEHHPIVINAVLTDAWAAIYAQQWPEAERLLAQTDRLIRESGQDDTSLRAEWYLARGQADVVIPDAAAARAHALDQAIQLFARVDPHNASYLAALANDATAHYAAGDYRAARTLDQQALATADTVVDRSDMDLMVIHSNLGLVLEALGEVAAADASYQRAIDLARRTVGERDGNYWVPQSRRAHLLHRRGERTEALALFDQVLSRIPADWTSTTDDAWVREYYADCLVAEGRAALAIPLLEAGLATDRRRPRHEDDVRRVNEVLGDAYDQVGRVDDARRALQAARDDYLAREPGTPASLASRERWARFLIDHPVAGQAAEPDLAAVIDAAPAWQTVSPASALAWADRARLALARGDDAAAETASTTALAVLDRVSAVFDVRLRGELLLVRSRVLRHRGDLAGAQAAAGTALVDALRYDAPDSPAIAAARAALAGSASR